jgi:hypothetical protein
VPLRTARQLAPPSAAVEAAVQKHRGRRARTEAKAARDTGQPALELALPHAVYDLRIDDLAKGCGLEAAQETGTRHLVMCGDKAVAAAEDSLGMGGADPVDLNTGRFAQATADAVRQLESLDAVQRGSYELRLLRIAALHLVALWLRSDDEAPDLVLVLPPAPAGVRVDVPYGPADLLALLRPRAAPRTAFKFHP